MLWLKEKTEVVKMVDYQSRRRPILFQAIIGAAEAIPAAEVIPAAEAENRMGDKEK